MEQNEIIEEVVNLFQKSYDEAIICKKGIQMDINALVRKHLEILSVKIEIAQLERNKEQCSNQEQTNSLELGQVV